MNDESCPSIPAYAGRNQPPYRPGDPGCRGFTRLGGNGHEYVSYPQMWKWHRINFPHPAVPKQCTKPCASNKVCNPLSARCVLRDGILGRRIVGWKTNAMYAHEMTHDMFKKIGKTAAATNANAANARYAKLQKNIANEKARLAALQSSSPSSPSTSVMLDDLGALQAQLATLLADIRRQSASSSASSSATASPVAKYTKLQKNIENARASLAELQQQSSASASPSALLHDVQAQLATLLTNLRNDYSNSNDATLNQNIRNAEARLNAMYHALTPSPSPSPSPSSYYPSPSASSASSASSSGSWSPGGRTTPKTSPKTSPKTPPRRPFDSVLSDEDEAQLAYLEKLEQKYGGSWLGGSPSRIENAYGAGTGATSSYRPKSPSPPAKAHGGGSWLGDSPSRIENVYHSSSYANGADSYSPAAAAAAEELAARRPSRLPKPSSTYVSAVSRMSPSASGIPRPSRMSSSSSSSSSSVQSTGASTSQQPRPQRVPAIQSTKSSRLRNEKVAEMLSARTTNTAMTDEQRRRWLQREEEALRQSRARNEERKAQGRMSSYDPPKARIDERRDATKRREQEAEEAALQAALRAEARAQRLKREKNEAMAIRAEEVARLHEKLRRLKSERDRRRQQA